MSSENIEENKFNFKDFIKKNKLKIFFLLSAIFLIVIGLIIFNDYKKKEIIEISKSFNTAKINLQKGDKLQAKRIFLSIIDKNDSFYSPSALNLIIENNLIKNENENEILLLYDKVIDNAGLDQETKNLFIFKKTLFIGDNISEEQLLNNLNTIIQSNSIWGKTVKNYIYEYYISRKEFEKAKEFKSLK